MAPAGMNWALSIPLLTILLIIIPKSESAPSYRYSICSNINVFVAKSSYESHLNSVLNSLSSNATNTTGFSTASSGNPSEGEAVYGLFLCRGDLNSTACKDCATNAALDLQQTYCPYRKVAYIWYDECMIRYSNESFLGKIENSPWGILWNPHNMTGNLTRFDKMVYEMLDNVSSQAASGIRSDGRKLGADSKNYSSSQTLYALAQCIPDLTDRDCAQCLAVAKTNMPISSGGRIMMPSCSLRYESNAFFSLLALQPSPSPPPLAPPIPHTITGTTTPVPAPHRKNHPAAGVMIAIVAPAVIVIAALLALGICLVNKKVKKHDVVADESGEGLSAFESLQYDLNTLQSATNNFSDENKLGQGGFGCVYKGTLPNGHEVAVKKLSLNSCQGVQEFKNEVLLVAKLQHKNLVRLLGFCLDGEEKLLVYEYVPNKSLDNFLFDPEKQRQLSWERRYKIINGIARGMLYLHQDSQLRIIHRDLKASNVLLDANMNPKIADFGMARIFDVDQSQATTNRVVGTYGYMSPEYAMRGEFSVKSDVYSFGILILEIISGKRNNAFIGSHDEDLLSYAWQKWRDGLPLEFADPTIWDSCSTDEVMRCIHLGLLCAQKSLNGRPTMGTIVLTLDSFSVTLPVPQQPGFIVKVITNSNSLEGSGSGQLVPWSVNDITVSEIDAR